MTTYKVGISRGSIAIALGLLAVSAFFISASLSKAAGAKYVHPTVDSTMCETVVGLGAAVGIDCFTDVASAVAAANDGDTITVASSTYAGGFTIAKDVTLQGEHASTTFITGQINITASGVTLTGFTISNPNGQFGILISAANNVTISNNTLTDIGNGTVNGVVGGIYFQDADAVNNSNLLISNNTLTNIGTASNAGGSTQAIGIGDSSGSGVFTGFVVSGNHISNVAAHPQATSPGKGAYGIQVNHAGTGHTGSTDGIQITNNTITTLSGRWVHAIGLEGNTPNAVVTGNSVSNLTSFSIYSGAVVTDGAAVFVQANPSISTITLSSNSFNTATMSMGVALHSTQTGTLNASHNFWNTGATNPVSSVGTGGGSVTVNPWYTAATMQPGDLIVVPTIGIVSSPISPSNDATADFTFSSNSAGATYQCSIDGLATTTCTTTTSHTTTALSEGTHTFTVVVTDTASLLTNSASQTFTLDFTAPTVTGVHTPNADGYYKFGTTTTFTVAFSEVVTVSGSPTLALNSSANATYQSGSGTNTLTFTYTVGFHESADLAYSDTAALTGSIADAAGNSATLTLPDPALFQAAHALIVDGIAPTLTPVSVIPTRTNDSTPTYVFDSNEAGTIVLGSVACQTTNTAAINGTNNLTLVASSTTGAGFTDGTYSCSVSVVDAAGNVSAAINTSNPFTVDTVAPSFSVSAAPAGSYGPGSSIAVSLNFSEPIVLTQPMEVSFGFGATCTILSSFVLTSALSCSPTVPTSGAVNGSASTTQVTIMSGGFYADEAGNHGSLAFTADMSGIIIDTVAPVLTLTGNSVVTLTVADSYTDAGATSDDSSTVVTTGSVNTGVVGIYTLTYNATDAAGNAASPITRTVYVMPDTNATSMTIATTTNIDGTISGTVPADLTLGGGSVMIPAGTVITGPSGWDGTILAPTATTTSSTPTGITGLSFSSESSIEVGSSLYGLTLSQPVRLSFPGKIGQFVGWSQNGGSFTHITATCAGDSQVAVDPQISVGGDCKLNVGGGLVVWTEHFTTFTTFAVTPNGTGVSSGGSGGGGGNGPVAVSTPGSSVSTGGEVLGAEDEKGYHFTRDLRIGSTGEDVTALQDLLIDLGHMTGPSTGYYGAKTSAAVKLYQKAHGIMQTGTVGPLTRAELNKGATTESSASTSGSTGTPALSKTQADAILGLLGSFGASQSVIDNVKKALGY